VCFNCAEAFDQYKTVAGYRTSQAQARTWKRSTRITITLPHGHPAIGSAKARNRDRGVDRRWGATTTIHKGEPDPTAQDAPTEMTAEAETATEGRPVDAFGVMVRVDRENAPVPDAGGAMGLPESKVDWVIDRFITDRRVLRYGLIDPTKSVH
jgi:hypothetical protein